MKGMISQPTLKAGLAMVGKAVAGKSTLPVLSHVLIVADEGGWRLSGTNLDTAITVHLSGRVGEPGELTIPAKRLTEVVGEYPNMTPITLTGDMGKVELMVEAARFRSSFKGLAADEFPQLPTVGDDTRSVEIPSDLLARGIEAVGYCAADSDDARPILSGVHFLVEGRSVQLTTADGFRAARYVITLPDTADEVIEPLEFIVKAASLRDLPTLLVSREPVMVRIGISASGGLVIFEAEHVREGVGKLEVASRLIDGQFPDVDRILPARFLTRAVGERDALQKAIKLAGYFAAESSNIIRMQFAPNGVITPGTVEVTANAAEFGLNATTVDMMVHQDDHGEAEGVGQVALNHKYLAEAVAHIDAPQIVVETQTRVHPAVFRPVGRDNEVHVIMPMTVR